VQQFLLGQAVDAGPVLIFVADEQGRYAAVNRRACEALGYTRAELLGMRVTDVAVSPEAPELYEAMLRRQHDTGVTPIRCKDGRLLPLRYHAAQVTVAQMAFWVSIGVIEPEG
jgi:PAS domain S-box-containing protein